MKIMSLLSLMMVSLQILCNIAYANVKPNILFVLVDDQNNETLGYTGHPIIKTPNIDRLAEKGVLFKNAFVTTSICMASRASIFTGLTQRTLNYRPRDPLGTTRITDKNLLASFPILLREAGYRTGYYGKNHVHYQNGNQFAFDLMFDEWEHLTLGMKELPNGTTRHSDELIGDRSVEFLRSQPEEQPFFLFMSMTIAHAQDRNLSPGMGHYPWPKAVDGMYEDVEPLRPRLDDPAVFESLPDFLKGSLNRSRYFWRWDTPEKYSVNMRAYYRMLTGMDGIVGRVLEELEKQGLRENTIVIYTADNGYYMGNRGFAGKWSHFEESMRVPLIIQDPRQSISQRGKIEQSFALNLDLPSTFLDLAGLNVPETYQGQSLTPFLSGSRPDDWRTFFFWEHHQFQDIIPAWSGIREERYAYAGYDRMDPPFEFLHDLQRDPDQLKNFADDPEYAEILLRLRQRTAAAIKQYQN